MTGGEATIRNGFAEVGAGAWLAGRAQPVAFSGDAVRRRRKGWFVRDRASLELTETSGRAWFADAARPFLTHIPCPTTVFAVSCKVLAAPAAARLGAELLKPIPMSVRGSICVTVFGLPPEEPNGPTDQRTNGPTDQRTNGPTVESDRAPDSTWVVMATTSRTERIQVADGDMLSVRPDAVVAWTGNRPTGFCPKLSVWDVLLPRGPRNMLFHFHGPSVVWIEGSNHPTTRLPNHQTIHRRYHGV